MVLSPNEQKNLRKAGEGADCVPEPEAVWSLWDMAGWDDPPLLTSNPKASGPSSELLLGAWTLGLAY